VFHFQVAARNAGSCLSVQKCLYKDRRCSCEGICATSSIRWGRRNARHGQRDGSGQGGIFRVDIRHEIQNRSGLVLPPVNGHYCSQSSYYSMKTIPLRPFLPTLVARRRLFAIRGYAIQAPGAPSLQVFNRHTKYLQKERAASDVETSRKLDYLKDEVASRLCERILV